MFNKVSFCNRSSFHCTDHDSLENSDSSVVNFDHLLFLSPLVSVTVCILINWFDHFFDHFIKNCYVINHNSVYLVNRNCNNSQLHVRKQFLECDNFWRDVIVHRLRLVPQFFLDLHAQFQDKREVLPHHHHGINQVEEQVYGCLKVFFKHLTVNLVK